MTFLKSLSTRLTYQSHTLLPALRPALELPHKAVPYPNRLNNRLSQSLNKGLNQGLNKGLPKGLNQSLSKAPQKDSISWTRIEAGEAATPEHRTSLLLNSPDEALATLLNRFDPAEITFPAETTGVYIDLSIAEYQLRLYVLTWVAGTSKQTTSEQATSEQATSEKIEPAQLKPLSLFLILGPIKGSYLPIDTQLRVKENNLLLSDPHLRWTAHPAYLYTQVLGLWEEQLTVEVLLPNRHPLALPPINFQSNHLLR
jgi:hypothetical protein